MKMANVHVCGRVGEGREGAMGTTGGMGRMCVEDH